MSNNVATIKSTIVEAVGSYNASSYDHIITPVAEAVANRGDKTVREAIVSTVGESRADTYSTYINRVVAALEEADETSDEPLKDIRSTIEDALGAIAAQYPDYVNTVVEALTEREYQIAESVLDAVVENTSFSAEDVKPFGERAGLTFRPVPVAVDEPAADADDEADAVEADGDVAPEVKGKIAELEERVGGIETSVAELLALAKRHLGA